MNKRGFAPLFVILGLVLGLIIIYCLLFIPIPAFTKVRMLVNYFLIIILWVLIQAGLIYGYYHGGKFVVRGFSTLKKMLTNWSLSIEKFIITH